MRYFRGSYRRFGFHYDSFAKASSSGGVSNPFQYTGRENDSETGLYCYRARYYDPTIGIFLSEDPARSSDNFYAYVHNNPITGTDPLGLWDADSHSKLIWNALRACMSKKDIWAMQQYSHDLDEVTQWPNLAHEHFMKIPGESDEHALAGIHKFIDDMLKKSASVYQEGNGYWAYFFAIAVHTITDGTSPAQVQNGHPITWPTYPNMFQHGNEKGSIETWTNMTPELMQQNIKMIRDAYKGVTGKNCGCQE